MELGKVEESLFATRFLVWAPRWIIASFKWGHYWRGLDKRRRMSSILFLLKLRWSWDKSVLSLVGLKRDIIR